MDLYPSFTKALFQKMNLYLSFTQTVLQKMDLYSLFIQALHHSKDLCPSFNRALLQKKGLALPSLELSFRRRTLTLPPLKLSVQVLYLNVRWSTLQSPFMYKPKLSSTCFLSDYNIQNYPGLYCKIRMPCFNWLAFRALEKDLPVSMLRGAANIYFLSVSDSWRQLYTSTGPYFYEP